MNTFCYVMLSIIILVAGFAATLVVASMRDVVSVGKEKNKDKDVVITNIYSEEV